ncbi:hypothetical protein K3495_g14680 [Podosphaera aphanis]|nr:hypothetical protein K3495_g14680 [Podosphaera aphanis]
MEKPSAPAKRAQGFVKRLREAEQLAQVAMASAQQRMEENANRKRNEAEIFREGYKVWLNLKNIQTPKLSKNLSWSNAKYQVTKVIDSHCVELNTPSADPLPSQIVDDLQPDAIEQHNTDIENENVNFHENEHVVERTLRAESGKIGRGRRRLLLVKWKDFAGLEWEPRENFEETEAIYGTGDEVHHRPSGKKTLI